MNSRSEANETASEERVRAANSLLRGEIRVTRSFHTAGVLYVRRGWGNEEARGDQAGSFAAVARFMNNPG